MCDIKKFNDIEEAIKAFINLIIDEKKYKISFDEEIETYDSSIYNEFSLQHELGIFLRENMEGNIKVFFEKNIYDNKKKEYINKHYWVKKEVDLIVIVYKDKNCTIVDKKFAIELKFKKGKNARTPENMFDFLRDIRFMEQIKNYRDFLKSFVLIIVDAEKYYYNQKDNNDKKTEWIYKIFRKDKTENEKEIKLTIPGQKRYFHPTGNYNKKKDTDDRDNFKLDRSYNTEWKSLKGTYKYIFIEANPKEVI